MIAIAAGRVPRERGPRAVRRKWSLGGIAGVAIIAAAWYYFGVQSSSLCLDRQWQEVENAYQRVSRAPAIKANHASAAAKNERMVAQLHRLRNDSRRSFDEVELLSWVGREAAALGVELTDYRPGGAVSYGDYGGTALQLNGRGAYDALSRLLDKLRRSPEFLRVGSLSLTTVDDAGVQLTFGLDLELLAHTPQQSDQMPLLQNQAAP